MVFADYLILKKDLESVILSAKEHLRMLDNEYFCANSLFPIGSKIKITTPSYIDPENIPPKHKLAYIIGFEIVSEGVILYKLVNVKKDGSKSSIKTYYSPSDILEKVEDN